MRSALILPLVLTGLWGCASAQAPVPQSVRLKAGEMTVVLSDATVCRAPVAATGGAGRLTDCGPGFDYEVMVETRPNLLRQFAVSAFGVLGAEGALAPMGRVVLTDAAGRSYDFVSPVPVPLD